MSALGSPPTKWRTGHGKEVLVVAAVRPVEVPEQPVHRRAQVIGGRLDGLLAARLAQQVEEDAHRVDQQLFRQGGHNAAPQHVVLFRAVVVQALGVHNGGAVPAEGAPQRKSADTP